MNKNIITGVMVVGTIATVGAIEANINKVDAASTYITTANLNLRASASTTSSRICLIPKGAKVVPLQYSNGWAKVSYGRYTGWCSAQYLTTKQVSNNNNSNQGYKVSGYKYTTSSLNLRSNPSTTASKICLMSKGSKVSILAYSNGWYKVNYKGYTGWCSAQYLSGSQTSNNTGNTNTTVKKGIVARRLIVINQCTMRLAYYENGKLVTYFSCATGKGSTPTPNGKFSIIHKEVNRPYYKGHIAGGSPNNPLGYRFLQLTSSGYAIHGTNVPSSIGGKVSHGCIRLANSNVEWLYNKVSVGTPVIIHSSSQGNKVMAAQYGYSIN